MTRPKGVAILACWNSLGAVVGIVGAVLILFSPTTLLSILHWLQENLPDSPLPLSSGTRVSVAIVYLGFGILCGCLANGLWQLRSWARTASIWLAALSLMGNTQLFVVEVVTTVMSFATIVYLSREKVVDAFSESKQIKNVQVSPESLSLT